MKIHRTISVGKPRTKEFAKIFMSLEKKEDGKICFSASGLAVYDSDEINDYVYGGQCLDKIKELHPDNKLINEVHELWRKYHLNDLKAGTLKQEEYLISLGEYINYDWACEELKKVGLYEDDGYRYGSAWLYREIPIEDLKRIKEIINLK